MNEVSVKVKISGTEEAINKAELLVRLLTEAKALAGELTSVIEGLEIKIQL